ncbi:MAG TPA: hypothetical protein VIV60_15110 [Polyangiaceae bacterium]
MSGDLPLELTKGIQAWALDARALLVCCERLAQWFGEKDDCEQLRATLGYLRDSISIAERFSTGALSLNDTKPRPKGELRHLLCGRRMAQALSPILELIVSDEPDFVGKARSILPESKALKLVGSYGNFLGAISHFWCGNIWRQYPELAPDGWNVAVGSGGDS